jgi:hypothetical protein
MISCLSALCIDHDNIKSVAREKVCYDSNDTTCRRIYYVLCLQRLVVPGKQRLAPSALSSLTH